MATDNVSNEIVGLCGFIKNTKELPGSDIWGALWKVIKTRNPMLGINILEYLNENSCCRSFSSLGIAKKTLPIYDFLRYKTGKLNRYYRLNNQENFQVAVVKEKIILDFNKEDNYSLQRLDNFEAVVPILKRIQNDTKVPYKDNWYLEKRYFNHPIYNYQVFGIKKEQIDSIIVVREIQQNETKILRIVDFIGNPSDICGIGEELQNLIDQKGYEYIDLYCDGIANEILETAGLKLKDEADLNVIPNYFEPFVQENVDIYYFTTHNEIFPIFKADGDQDRPSRSNLVS
ncbi:MAG: hypothetical protein M0D53_13170 [Flavobacterium sp. JAD_PAG50586_2]|nr:MAG: hypothetical protein M0D53_13170 [Flavobacterium sp. JAD_PAG50586_2]